MSHSRGSPDSRPDAGRPDLTTAAAAHDLNQMLAVISGRLSLLMDKVADPVLQEHFQAMLVACRDATAMVRRLAGAGADPDARLCDARQEALSAAAMVLPSSGHGGGPRCLVEVPAGLAAGLPGQVLREVLVNLLVNARQALGGTGSVTISGRLAGPRIRIEVADDGPGVDPAVAGRLFQAGVSGTDEPGRGLGLAGCRELLGRFGGSLELAASGPGGAVFALEVPVAGPALEKDGGSPPASAAGNGRPHGGRIKVLVVDDESAVRDMLSDVLPELGCVVTALADGEAALATFASGAFQVALLDRNLPGMSGVELAERLRSDDPSLVVMMMTGWGAGQDLAGPADAAVDFILRKPMEFKELQGVLQEAVRLHAGRAAAAGQKR